MLPAATAAPTATHNAWSKSSAGMDIEESAFCMNEGPISCQENQQQPATKSL
jgi:hypothetical protein